MTPFTVTNPADSTHCINVVYIGFAKPPAGVPMVDDKRLINASAVVIPGESLSISLIKGFGSVSMHEGQPFVRLIPSTDAAKGQL